MHTNRFAPSLFLLPVSVILMLLLIYCTRQTGPDAAAFTGDSLSAPEQNRLSRRKQQQDQLRSDSVQMALVLDNALRRAKTHIHAFAFTEAFETTPEGFRPVQVQIRIGHVFSGKQRHLLIRRKGERELLLNAYLIQGNDLKPVLTHRDTNAGVRDTLEDANSDGEKDVVLKNETTDHVYEYVPSDGSFILGDGL